MPIDISPAGESARPPPFTVARGAADNAGRPDKSDGLSEGEMIVDRGFHRYGTGWRRAGDGRVSSGRTRSVSGAAGADALRQIRAEPLRAHSCRRATPLARRGRSLFRAPRLRRHLSGLP